MTSCLHLPGNKEKVFNSLKTLFENETAWHHVTRYFLVNEYHCDNDARCVEDAVKRIQKLYPFLTVIQKDAHSVGQAESINIILKLLKDGGEKYWMHWEESWLTKGPFLERVLGEMQNDPTLGQVQVAKGWMGLHNDSSGGIAKIKDSHVDAVMRSLGNSPVRHARWKHHVWPLYSLQPGIDRSSTVTNIGIMHPRHNANPRGKVDGAEFNFSHRWFCQGYYKAVLVPYVVFRAPNHISTKWLIKK